MRWSRHNKFHKIIKHIEIHNIRPLLLQLVFVIMFLVLLCRLWTLQIQNGQEYLETFELKITRSVREPSTRGLIYDCNGEILADNRLIYTVTMVDNGVYASDRERQLTLNSIVYRVIHKLAENQENICTGLKIALDADGTYSYTVTGSAKTRFIADIYGKSNPDDLKFEQKISSAEEIVHFLAGNQKFALYGEGKTMYTEEELQEYGLPRTFTPDELLQMVDIRYQLSLNDYKKYMPVVVARNVSEKTVAYILENNQHLTGVDVGQDWERFYTGGEACSHILGYTGRISTEELEKYQESDKGYTADYIVGKAGIEQYLEEQLQGTEGEKQITVNNVGKTIGDEITIREAVSGSDVYCSIDKELQTVVYSILEQNLAGIVTSNLIDAKTFDKTHVADASDILIPIYDVYIALVENHIIRLDALYREDASVLEQQIAALLQEKYTEALKAVRGILMAEDANYNTLPNELREYISYIIEECDIFESETIDQEDALYLKWSNEGTVSPKAFLMYAIEKGWITAGLIESQIQYITAEEMYTLLLEHIEDELAARNRFHELLMKYLILEDRVSGKDICLLLYEQEVLMESDSDYESLSAGKMSEFAFLKKKIKQLEITPAQLALDPCSASAVVVEANTGKVRALVSYPGYNNNRLANQMDGAYYNQLLNDRSLPLYNRATQQLTAPGSTWKPLTIIAGLQEGVITEDSAIMCNGVFDRVEPHLRCWKRSGHGNVVNAPTAIQFSCNDYLCEVAYRMGMGNRIGTNMEYMDSKALQTLQNYASLFCLDKKSGVELTESMPHVTDASGIQSAIGQGTHNYATIQIARYINTIATRGNVFSLSLINGITDADGILEEQASTLEKHVKLPDSVWETVGQGMEQFAQNNSILKNMELRIAGKTGTAQESKTRPDHALFVGYAPADAPEITIAVRIANGYGSSNATAVGKSIFDYYFALENQEDIVTGEATQASNMRTD